MGIDSDTFLKWATEHFGAENIRFRGDEICTHSVFTDDHKFHLWMNPTGGKKGLAGGAYRCWKTDRKGTLISLVAHIDNIPYDEAEERLTGTTSLRSLEKKLFEFFRNKDEENEVTEAPTVINALELPPHTYLIDDLSSRNSYKARAVNYLNGRKIPTEGLFVCINGDYRNRIVIPYYDRDGDLIYYNARTMDSSPKVLRYMKPDSDVIKQNEILYLKSWPRPSTKVYITEGEFDALTLNICGLHGAACGGKFLSPAQIELLWPYTPVIATDGDKSGRLALISIGNSLLSRGFKEVYYIQPPKNYKDWNGVLEKNAPESVKSYITKNEKAFTTWTEDVFVTKGLL